MGLSAQIQVLMKRFPNVLVPRSYYGYNVSDTLNRPQDATRETLRSMHYLSGCSPEFGNPAGEPLGSEGPYKGDVGSMKTSFGSLSGLQTETDRNPA